MEQIKKVSGGKEVLGVSYPYINGHRIAVLKDSEGYAVEREYINGDNPGSRFYRITTGEFNLLASIEHDPSDEASYASKLLSTFREISNLGCQS